MVYSELEFIKDIIMTIDVPRRFHIHTFGCQMNENDSERLAGALSALGWHPASMPEESDLVIVNTCAVREKSVDKLFSYLGRLFIIKKKRPLLIGVAGCVAQLYRGQILERSPYVDFILGPDNYWRLPEIVRDLKKGKSVSTSWSRRWREAPQGHIIRDNGISAYVTIMEGCNNFCSYCIVPFTRGREKFRPLSHIVQEVELLAGQGYKEIQLLGQNVNSYRDPGSGSDFASLLENINRIEGPDWIRFITSHPKYFDRRTIQVMADSPKICRQLHLPAQSGSDAVLKRMKRGYTREEYLGKVALLRREMPEISLSADIIVGFPGETEIDFEDTLRLLREVRYQGLFSFRYSTRPHTAAAGFKDSVPLDVKRRRLSHLQEAQKQIQMETNSRLIGKEMKVLCMGRSKKDTGVFSGRNEGYQVVNFTSAEDVIGRFVKVMITDCGSYSLKGKMTSLSG